MIKLSKITSISIFLITIVSTCNFGMNKYNDNDKTKDYQIFKAIQRIHDIIEKEVQEGISNETISYAELGRTTWPDPNPDYYGKTTGRLWLRFTSTEPLNTLHTPWGGVKLLGSFCGNFEQITQTLFERCKLETSEEVSRVVMVDEITLPEEISTTQDWETLKEKYDKEKALSSRL